MKIEEFHYVFLSGNQTVHLLWNWKDVKTKCGRLLDDCYPLFFVHDYEAVKDGPFCKNCMRRVN